MEKEYTENDYDNDINAVNDKYREQAADNKELVESFDNATKGLEDSDKSLEAQAIDTIREVETEFGKTTDSENEVLAELANSKFDTDFTKEDIEKIQDLVENEFDNNVNIDNSAELKIEDIDKVLEQVGNSENIVEVNKDTLNEMNQENNKDNLADKIADKAEEMVNNIKEDLTEIDHSSLHNSESAFDRGMGEMFENMDKPEEKAEDKSVEEKENYNEVREEQKEKESTNNKTELVENEKEDLKTEDKTIEAAEKENSGAAAEKTERENIGSDKDFGDLDKLDKIEAAADNAAEKVSENNQEQNADKGAEMSM